MILHDFIMLGKTLPEVQKRDGRVFVCSAGYSQEMRKFIRVYPLAREKAPRRWDVCQIALERNPRDSRDESWAIRADRTGPNHRVINAAFHIDRKATAEERSQIIGKMSGFCRSIDEANSRRISLFVLQPKAPVRLDFVENRDSPDHPQMWLFDAMQSQEPEGAKRFAFQPYLTFEDEGGSHRLQLRDWGCYEFMRKHGDDRRFELRDILKLEKRPPLLLGNMNGHRNTWLIIGVFPSQAAATAPLFDFAGVSHEQCALGA